MRETRLDHFAADAAGHVLPGECLVFSLPTCDAPPALLAGLRKQGRQTRIVHQPAQVMLELARRNVAACIVDRSADLPRLPELMAAIQRYYPRVVCWQYHPASGLTPIRQSAARENAVATPDTERQSRDDMSPLLTAEELEMLLGPLEPATGVGGKADDDDV